MLENDDLTFRDVDADVEAAEMRKHDFSIYDTEPLLERACGDCGRRSHCEC